MSDTIVPLTKENFLNCSFNQINTSSGEKNRRIGARDDLGQLAKKAEENGDIGKHAVLQLLVQVYSYYIEPENRHSPFKPMWIGADGRRSALPEDLSKDQLDFLDEIKDDVQEPLLKSRIAEILWLFQKPKNIANAKQAIDTYMTFELSLPSFDHESKELWIRAINLSLMIKDFKRLDQIKEHLLVAIRSSSYDEAWLSFDLSEIMQTASFKDEENEEIISILENFIEKAKQEKSWRVLQRYAGNTIEWYKRVKDGYNESRLKMEIAESYRALADTQEHNLGKGQLYEQALQSYRTIPNRHREDFDVEAQIKELHKLMRTANRLSLDEMAVISSPTQDISELIKNAQQHVTQKPFPVALLYYSGLCAPQSKETYIEDAKKTAAEFVFQSLTDGVTIADDGRITARHNSYRFDTEEEKNLWQNMTQKYRFHMEIYGKSALIPALHTIYLEHTIKLSDIIELCRLSTIVDEDRTLLWARGLYFGFEHDFTTAIHLLVPQIEHYVRSKLYEADVTTSTVEQNGVEKELGLSALLAKPEAEEILGADLHFELEMMLSKGFNLRNDIAHGLLSFNQCHTYLAIYFWWYCLKLMIRGLPWQDDGKGKDNEEND